MKLFSIFVLYKPAEASGGGQAKILKSASDLSSFGFFQRGSVEEFMKFTAKIITERSATATRSSVKEQEYFAHVYLREDNLSAVIISDQEYPKRVAHSLLNKVNLRFSIANIIIRNIKFCKFSRSWMNSAKRCLAVRGQISKKSKLSKTKTFFWLV
jgi:synaptobrevin family protein YKT6